MEEQCKGPEIFLRPAPVHHLCSSWAGPSLPAVHSLSADSSFPDVTFPPLSSMAQWGPVQGMWEAGSAQKTPEPALSGHSHNTLHQGASPKLYS